MYCIAEIHESIRPLQGVSWYCGNIIHALSVSKCFGLGIVCCLLNLLFDIISALITQHQETARLKHKATSNWKPLLVARDGLIKLPCSG